MLSANSSSLIFGGFTFFFFSGILDVTSINTGCYWCRYLRLSSTKYFAVASAILATYKMDLRFSGNETGSYSLFWSILINYPLLWLVSTSKILSRCRLIPGLRVIWTFLTVSLLSSPSLLLSYSLDCTLGRTNFRVFLVLTIIFLIFLVILRIIVGTSSLFWVFCCT